MGTVGTGSIKSRFIKTKWPVEEGLTAGTTKLPKQYFLKAQKSLVSKKEVGL